MGRKTCSGSSDLRTTIPTPSLYPLTPTKIREPPTNPFNNHSENIPARVASKTGPVPSANRYSKKARPIGAKPDSGFPAGKLPSINPAVPKTWLARNKANESQRHASQEVS